jgi:hypothetical protein
MLGYGPTIELPVGLNRTIIGLKGTYKVVNMCDYPGLNRTIIGLKATSYKIKSS